MAGLTEALRGLHRLHQELYELNESLQRGPRQLKARDQKIRQVEQRVVELKGQLKESRAGADRKSLDLKGKEARLSELRARLNACSSNREYDLLRGQIEADEVANSVLEDEILEILEKVDRTQREIGETEEQARTLQQDRETFAAEFAEKSVQLQKQVEEVLGRIREREKFLTGEAAQMYRRLVQSYGADGMAAVDPAGVCMNCYMKLTPQALVQVRMGEIVFCTTCGRLVYAEESQHAAT